MRSRNFDDEGPTTWGKNMKEFFAAASLLPVIGVSAFVQARSIGGKAAFGSVGTSDLVGMSADHIGGGR